MLRSRAGKFGILLVASLALSAALLRRNATGTVSGGNALLPPSADGAARADSAAAAADTAARPTKPKRQIVPDVEVVVNIPSGRLRLVQGDSVIKTYPVSVGSARYPTPVGDYLLATVIWNPWWNPPPESSWARNRKPEPPGPNNPMGRVKLHMDELIYIHGTTSEGRLGAPASHGCIRMSNADVVDLARRLHQIAAPGMETEELDRMSRSGRTERHTVMARSIRMRVTYNVAELRGERLHVYPDVYSKGGDFAARVRGELARGGVDSVPGPALSRLRASANARGGTSFALADIPDLRPLPPSAPRETGPRVLGTTVAEAPAAPEPPRDTLFFPTAPASEPAAVDTTTDDQP